MDPGASMQSQPTAAGGGKSAAIVLLAAGFFVLALAAGAFVLWKMRAPVAQNGDTTMPSNLPVMPIPGNAGTAPTTPTGDTSIAQVMPPSSMGQARPPSTGGLPQTPPQPGKPVTTGGRNTHTPQQPAPPQPSAPPTQPTAAPQDDQGYLTMVTYPWTRVTIAGKTLTTPFSKVALPPGSYTAVLENPDQGIRQTMPITIKAGDTTTKNLSLK
jgi:serine/threonine-protein kinase